MILFLVIAILIVALLFGIASISQSYAAVQQAQTTIKTARMAQVARLGNLVSILVIFLLLAAVIVIELDPGFGGFKAVVLILDT